ncbi:DUF4393 domain-containing protein [Abiotrophia defectiva]|uniref:DUF4393 domain-containing protein n=1 Tax=Abiotrophia defectiva TaxID=46125 RepID=UPI0028D1C063|nr:DUF4393 domain-containing protein [Abiotrophia defectiva]
MDSNLPQLPISSETGDALAKPIAESVGNAGKDILESVFHFALDGLRKYNIRKQYELKKFEEEVKEKTDSIPPEHRDDSKIGLVLKAIEDSRYQLEEEEIRRLFTKLIAATMDNRKNESVIPIYSSIISNMTPSEAKTLERIYSNTLSLAPHVRLIAEESDSVSERDLDTSLIIFDWSAESGLEIQLSLLEAAGLIEFIKDSQLMANQFQRRYELSEKALLEIAEAKNLHLGQNEKFAFRRSYYRLTSIGKAFCKVVFE